MIQIKLLPNIKHIAAQTGRGVRWCWSNTWSLLMLTVIESSVQYVGKMKETFLRNSKYSSYSLHKVYVNVYKLRLVSQSIQSHKVLSCSTLPAPYFRNRNIKSQYQASSNETSPTDGNITLLSLWWILLGSRLKVSDYILELLKQIDACLSIQ